MRELAGTCRTGAALQLPAVRLAASSLGDLRTGSLLRLNLPASGLAEFRAGGVLLFSASAAGRADHRAAHLVAARETKP